MAVGQKPKIVNHSGDINNLNIKKLFEDECHKVANIYGGIFGEKQAQDMLDSHKFNPLNGSYAEQFIKFRDESIRSEDYVLSSDFEMADGEFLKLKLTECMGSLLVCFDLLDSGHILTAMLVFSEAQFSLGICSGFLSKNIFVKKISSRAGKTRLEKNPTAKTKNNAKLAIKIDWEKIPKSKKTYGWKVQFANRMQAKFPHIEDVETIKKWVRSWEQTLPS